MEGTCSHLPGAVITAPFNAHICFRLISIQIRRGSPGIPAFLWFDWLPAHSLHLSECHINPFHGLATVEPGGSQARNWGDNMAVQLLQQQGTTMSGKRVS